MVNVSTQEAAEISGPFRVGGYKIYPLLLEKGKQVGIKGRFAAVVVKGRTSLPVIACPYQGFFAENTSLKADEETRLFIAEDEGETEWFAVEGAELKWKHISELVPGESKEKRMLYTDPYLKHEPDRKRYRVRFWLVGPDVDCGIHDHAGDIPQFREVHLQLRGSGWMELFNGKSGDKLLETPMHVGRVHDPFFVEQNGKVRYWPHRYRSGPKGSLFMVVEELV